MKVGKLRFVICVWFLFLYGSCLCRTNSSLKVSSPENLKGTYKCALSSFSVLPEHGGTLTGVVVYPKLNQQACNTFPHQLSFKTKADHVVAAAGSLPVFLLVDDKDCYSTSKARNAQNVGAAGILIAYDEFFPTRYYPKEVDVYDDKNLTIPSALITKSLGDSMKKALDGGEFVRVNLEWTEAFTPPVDCDALNCYDQTEEDEENEVLPDFMLRLMIKYIPFWGCMVLYVKSWLVFLFIGGEPTTTLGYYSSKTF